MAVPLEQFVRQLEESGVLSTDTLQDFVPPKASPKDAEDLIRDGRVSIDARAASLGDRVDPAREQVSVDGVPIAANPSLRYFALNKPAGVVSTAREPGRRVAG